MASLVLPAEANRAAMAASLQTRLFRIKKVNAQWVVSCVGRAPFERQSDIYYHQGIGRYCKAVEGRPERQSRAMVESISSNKWHSYWAKSAQLSTRWPLSQFLSDCRLSQSVGSLYSLLYRRSTDSLIREHITLSVYITSEWNRIYLHIISNDNH